MKCSWSLVFMCVAAHYVDEVCYDSVSSGINSWGLSDASVGHRLFPEHGFPRAKVDKVNLEMSDICCGWLLSSHCFIFLVLLKAAVLHLYRIAMTTSLWWARGGARNALDSTHYVNVHRCQHQMHTVTAINKGFANWLVLLISRLTMRLMIMPCISLLRIMMGCPVIFHIHV